MSGGLSACNDGGYVENKYEASEPLSSCQRQPFKGAMMNRASLARIKPMVALRNHIHAHTWKGKLRCSRRERWTRRKRRNSEMITCESSCALRAGR